MAVPTETLIVTLTQEDKTNLKVMAATQNTTMRNIVRGLIREAVAGTEVHREPVIR
jgi:hypothetical protein